MSQWLQSGGVKLSFFAPQFTCISLSLSLSLFYFLSLYFSLSLLLDHVSQTVYKSFKLFCFHVFLSLSLALSSSLPLSLSLPVFLSLCLSLYIGLSLSLSFSLTNTHTHSHLSVCTFCVLPEIAIKSCSFAKTKMLTKQKKSATSKTQKLLISITFLFQDQTFFLCCPISNFTTQVYDKKAFS